MKITRIKLYNFRNYKDSVFDFPESGAFIFGENGSGKTNLFEALAYNSLGKSFRYRSDDFLVRFEQNGFSIQTECKLSSGDVILLSHYFNGRKRISINQNPVRHLSQIYEYLKVIYCSPEDINLISGSPRKRRQYFDLAIAQLVPNYIHYLRQYMHVVDQRNSILKKASNIKQKKHWDELFINAALPVIATRVEYIHKLKEKMHKLYDNIVAESKSLEIAYLSSINVFDNEIASKTYKSDLKKVESREWQYQRSLLGPHLDDYIINLSGEPLKETGSQGQQRTTVLLLKMAHLEMIKEAIGDYPILLLDDIFAELDDKHTKQFMQILKNHEQVFVASPNAQSAINWADLPMIELRDGGIVR